MIMSEHNKNEEQLTAEPKVYDYIDYRAYLSDWFSWKKKVSQSYSTAIFARKAGINSRTLLGMIIRGRRNLSISTLNGFIAAVGLKASEANYFEKLVGYNQAKKPSEKQRYLSDLTKSNSKILHKNLFKLKNYSLYLSHWYFVAIREMVFLDDFNDEPKWIAKKLKNKVSLLQVKEAWGALVDLELVNFDKKQKKYVANIDCIDVDPQILDFGVRNFHRESINRALLSVDEESIDERELSSVTMALSLEEYEEVKEMINKIRKKINLEYANTSSKKTMVVTLNSQLLQLTK